MQTFSECCETHKMREWHKHVREAGWDLHRFAAEGARRPPLELKGCRCLIVPPAHPE